MRIIGAATAQDPDGAKQSSCFLEPHSGWEVYVPSPIREINAHLVLIPADTDLPLIDTRYQQSLRRVLSALQAWKIPVTARTFVQDNIEVPQLLGEFVMPLTELVGPTIGGIVIPWLAERAGRRVRVRVLGREIEAQPAASEDTGRVLKFTAIVAAPLP